MTKHQSSETRGPTLDEEAKPRTTKRTDVQIEDQKKRRRTGKFPPEPADKDIGVEDAVERASWDRLKTRPHEDKTQPPYD